MATTLLLIILLPACTANEFFRTEISDVPCVAKQTNACGSANLLVNPQDDYSLSFVEIDDQGQFYDRRQADSLIGLLKSQAQAQYVMLYVHGWHHNAAENDFGLKRFKEVLKDSKQRHPERKVTGIYVGWRGETLTIPWLRALTFWDRKAVSEEVGRNSLLDFLLQLETAVMDKGHPDNILLTVGHSLGASVLFNSLHQVLLERLAQPENSNVRRSYGNLVVLINPAFEAIRYAAIRAAAQRHGRQFQYGDQQQPVLIVATAEADNITKRDFSWSRVFSALFEAHRSIPADSRNPDDGQLSEWELDTTAIGHFQQFTTHRLQSNDTIGNDYSCSSSPQWLKAAVDRRKIAQLDGKQPATGDGWDTGDGISMPALLVDTSQLQLIHLQNSAAYDPYWVIQTARGILPNHGFFAQKNFWCFIDLSIADAIAKTASSRLQ